MLGWFFEIFDPLVKLFEIITGRTFPDFKRVRDVREIRYSVTPHGEMFIMSKQKHRRRR